MNERMNEMNTTNGLVDAIIYLKNGLMKYGVLLNATFKNEVDFRFIASSDLNFYKATSDPRYIETISVNYIEAIDIALK